jgi:hypothetical protein
MPAPHAAVTHELLVRYLDSWTPAVLHGHRRATYCEAVAGRHPGGSDDSTVATARAAGVAVEPASSAVAAVRVFCEFSDLLADHHLTVVLVGDDDRDLRRLVAQMRRIATESGSPAGLDFHSFATDGSNADTSAPRASAPRTSPPRTSPPGTSPPAPGTSGGARAGSGGAWPGLREALAAAGASGSPLFCFIDQYDRQAAPAADWRTELTALAKNKMTEILVAVNPSTFDGTQWSGEQLCTQLRAAGLGFTCHAELVDESGAAERLVFATGSDKHLEKFKDELWALDEYAGIRYRDPSDPEHTLLDISLDPHLGPLKRALHRRVIHAGPCTVAQLRRHAVHETLYRSADATRAVQALIAAGMLRRTPSRGRLSPTTEISASTSAAVSASTRSGPGRWT